MARGIEELAEMQVTGPVQGGDMVMKPDQAPAGAAALLNKMSRQNTPGVFKLPMPDKQMPDFMKVAAEGVEQQTAKGDTINQMAGELLRQGLDIRGMEMDEIIKIYEQTFGSPGDVDEFGVSEVDQSDWRTILKMLEAGMSWEEIEAQTAQAAAMKFPGNFTDKKQEVTELPRNLKTSEDAPETELAYITDDEKAMLALMNPGTPHEGPKGVPTYDEDPYDVQQYQPGGFYNQPPSQAVEDEYDAPDPVHEAQTQADINAAIDRMKDKGQYTATPGQAEGTGIVEFVKGIIPDNALDLLGTAIGFPGSLTLKGVDALAEGAAAWEREQVKDLISKIGTGDAATGWGNLLHDFKKDPDKAAKWFEDWEDELGTEDWDEETRTRGKIDWEKMSPEEKTDELIRMASSGGGDKFLKEYDPDTYYKDPKNWDAKEMAQAQREGKLKFTRDNTAMIEEGRRRLEQEGGPERGRQYGTGRPIEEQITEEIAETTTTDPRAGSWNLGGTMPYTHDVATGGTQMDVPLGRRFQIGKDKKYRGTTGGMDLNEAMQYATLGGYGQLEPFQEYLTRRREHLGEEEPRYFDEEGNVIYSTVT